MSFRWNKMGYCFERSVRIIVGSVFRSRGNRSVKIVFFLVRFVQVQERKRFLCYLNRELSCRLRTAVEINRRVFPTLEREKFLKRNKKQERSEISLS